MVDRVFVESKANEFSIADPPPGTDPVLGKPLSIPLSSFPFGKGSSFSIRLQYSTTPQSEATQWLTPAQTAGKKHPYLFTQCQPVHARSLVPCQDTPAVKFRFTAAITAPTELEVLMGALKGNSESVEPLSRTHYFRQPLPIPSYLLAIAIGDLTRRDVGPRTAVWSEPAMLEAAAYEFGDTERFVATAEQFLTGYEWGRYDLLILPPSFPYGGMENPCLTFVTPTLLAGDRSLCSLVAHELSHSWSGNLVTNRSAEHFWLNEGFTMYLQRRIMARCFGQPVADLDAAVGRKALHDDIARFGPNHEFTKLVPRLRGADPDDAYSDVPYEKGYTFLLYLAAEVLQPAGHDALEQFLKSYFTHFRYQSVDSSQFREYFTAYFTEQGYAASLAKIDWNAWLHSPGYPPVEPPLDTSLSDAAHQLAEQWLARGTEMAGSGRPSDVAVWHTLQKVAFLEHLAAKAPLHSNLIDALDAEYALSTVQNAEVMFAWQMLCLKSHYTKIFDAVVEFLASQGRMKFVRPLYRELVRASPPAGRELAVATFSKNMGLYHPIAVKMVSKDLGLAG